MHDRLLLRGARVITMDPELGELDSADLLLEDGRIRAIAPTLGEVDAECVELAGKLVIPGLVDTHRHGWQAPLRGLGADWTVLDYLAAARMKIAPALSERDVYWGSLAGGLEALELGITTLVDYAHCVNSPAHAEAAYAGLEASGVGGVFAYGLVANGGAFCEPVERLQHARTFFAAHAGAHLGVAFALSEMQIPWEQTVAELRLARELTARITFHSTAWPTPGMSEIARLADAGLLGPDMLLVHCTHASDDDLARMADEGAALSSTPETELQMGMGFPAIGRALRAGVRCTLGSDVAVSNNADPFVMMRLALQVGRGLENSRVGLPQVLRPQAADVLAMMTTEAAHALGMTARIGSLRPGKQADLLVLSTDTMNMQPTPLCAGELVAQAHAGNVQSVLVNGRFVKRDGVLVGVDIARVRRELRDTRDELLGRIGGRAALLSELPALHAQWNLGQNEVFSGSAG